jgi:hypothetical protein
MNPNVISKVKNALVTSVYYVTNTTLQIGFDLLSFWTEDGDTDFSQLTDSKLAIYKNLCYAVNRVYSIPEGLVAR